MNEKSTKARPGFLSAASAVAVALSAGCAVESPTDSVAEPAAQTELRVASQAIVGYAAEDTTGQLRVYPSLGDLSAYYLVSDRDIIREEAVVGSDGLQATKFSLRNDTRVVLSSALSADEQATLLDGTITRDLTAAGARTSTGPTPNSKKSLLIC